MCSTVHSMASMGERSKPNVLITGTPGTGKSTLSVEVVEKTGLKHIDVGEVAKLHNFYMGWDEKYQCHILDEDKLLDELEDAMIAGGNIVEYHSCELFPERWFDAVFVLRTDNTILYDRLLKRDYNEQKIVDNIQCEIFQTILEEARENYSDSIVHELCSNLPEDMEKNLEAIIHFISEWS